VQGEGGFIPMPAEFIQDVERIGDAGLIAIRTRSNGLSSPAVRFEDSVPQPWQRWIRTHSPSLRTVMAIGSIEA